MIKHYLPVRHSKGKCTVLFSFMLLLYLMENLSFNAFIGYNLYNYVVEPISWLILFIIVWLFPRIHAGGSLKQRENLTLLGFIFGVIHIFVSMAGGILDGFGKSPYSHTFGGILLNIWVIGSLLTGREFVRGFIVNNLTRKDNFTVFISISLFFTILNYQVRQFTTLKTYENLVIFIAQYVMPDFCRNLLATYLAYLGGWAPAMIYMGSYQAFQWLSPVLPNLKWITAAFIGILCPVFSLCGAQSIHMKETGAIRGTARKKEGIIGWIVICILSIGLIWFTVGVFPVYPSVIATGSMEPMISPGDMIVLEKFQRTEDFYELKAGDVIQFLQGDVLITHRIAEIIHADMQVQFRTKGDNNSSADSQLVMPEQIRGRLLYVIPKAGWPTLLIKKRNDEPLESLAQ